MNARESLLAVGQLMCTLLVEEFRFGPRKMGKQRNGLREEEEKNKTGSLCEFVFLTIFIIFYVVMAYVMSLLFLLVSLFRSRSNRKALL